MSNADKKMKLKKDNLVVINIPRFAIPEEFAETYVTVVNKFCSDLRISMIQDWQDGMSIGDFDTMYANNNFYPIFYKRTNYEGIGSIITPQIQNISKYIEHESGLCIDRGKIVSLFEENNEEEN